MAECGKSIYEMIEYLGIADLAEAQIIRAEIVSIDRNNCTANVTLTSPGDIDHLIDLTAVDIWYHCEDSAGTLADLARGHLAFRDEDDVYLLIMPEAGEPAESRAFVIGHVDIRDTRVCGREYLYISMSTKDEGLPYHPADAVYDGPGAGIRFTVYDTVRCRTANLDDFPPHAGKPTELPALETTATNAWKATVFFDPTSTPINHTSVFRQLNVDGQVEICSTNVISHVEYGTHGESYKSIDTTSCTHDTNTLFTSYAKDWLVHHYTNDIDYGLGCLYHNSLTVSKFNEDAATGHRIYDETLDEEIPVFAMHSKLSGVYDLKTTGPNDYCSETKGRWTYKCGIELVGFQDPTGERRDLGPCSIYGMCTEWFRGTSFNRVMEPPYCPYYTPTGPQSVPEAQQISLSFHGQSDATSFLPEDEIANWSLSAGNRCQYAWQNTAWRWYEEWGLNPINQINWDVRIDWEQDGPGGGPNDTGLWTSVGLRRYYLRRGITGVFLVYYHFLHNSVLDGGWSSGGGWDRPHHARPVARVIDVAAIERAARNPYNTTPADILDNPIDIITLTSFSNKAKSIRLERAIKEHIDSVFALVRANCVSEWCPNNLHYTFRSAFSGPGIAVYMSNY